MYLSNSENYLSSSKMPQPTRTADCVGPFSVYASIYQCKSILERLRTDSQHYRRGRPMPQRVDEALIRLENTLKFCLPVCVNDSPKMYPCVSHVLASVIRSDYHNLVKLYFESDPLWQLYMQTVLETMTILSSTRENEKSADDESVAKASFRERLASPGAKMVSMVKNLAKIC